MIDVTEGHKQADAHLLVLGKNHFDLIDTGFSGLRIVPFLKRSQINHLKNIFISHPHKDHYGGTQALVESGITVENFWINIPSKDFCDTEKPLGCDYAHILSTIEFMKSKGVKILSMKPNVVLDQSPIMSLKSLIAYQDTNSPTGRQGGINDTSVLMKLTTLHASVLFTGDLNLPLGTYLAEHMDAALLQADFLKVPHHGTEGCAPNSFFDKVSPKFALVPSPAPLWVSERSKRIHDYWLNKKEVQTFVSGIHGNVYAALLDAKPSVKYENHWYNPNWVKRILEKLP